MPATNTNPYLDPVTPEMQAIIDQYATQLGVPSSRLAFVDGELLFLNDQGEVEQLNLGNTFGGGATGSVSQFGTGAFNQGGQRGAPQRGRASLVPALGAQQRKDSGGMGVEGQGAQPGAGSVSEVDAPSKGALAGSQVAQMALGALAPGALPAAGAIDMGLRGLNAITGLGAFGVVGGSNRPAVGSEDFDRTVALGRQASARSRAQEGVEAQVGPANPSARKAAQKARETSIDVDAPKGKSGKMGRGTGRNIGRKRGPGSASQRRGGNERGSNIGRQRGPGSASQRGRSGGGAGGGGGGAGGGGDRGGRRGGGPGADR